MVRRNTRPKDQPNQSTFALKFLGFIVALFCLVSTVQIDVNLGQIRRLEKQNLARVSAVLLNWRRPENVGKQICEIYDRYEFVTEFLVVNNDYTVRIIPESFPRCSGLDVSGMIKVINSPDNLNTEGRYQGCLAAENYVCYFIDDDFWPRHVDGLHASFVRAPDYLHALTGPEVYWNNLRWTAFSDEGSPTSRYTVHTGFSWVGSGSMVLKRNCQRFIKQMDSVNLSKEERGIADNFFSIWMNRIPYQLEIQLSTAGLSQDFAYTSSPEISERLHQARNKALDILVANLKEQNPLFATNEDIFFSDSAVNAVSPD